MTDEDAITLIRSGGKPMEAAVRSLYASTGQAMLRFFTYQGASADDARDVLQETFVRIVSSAHTYRGEGAATAWMWQIARNCLAEFARTTLGRSRYEQAVNEGVWLRVCETVADPTTPSASVRAADECVSRGLAAFARRESERVYVLSLVMDGYDIAAIAHQIGRSAAATKQYLYESRKKLAPYLEPCKDLLAQRD